MTIDELKQKIELSSGVPAHLLTGETAEELIAQAKAFIAYKEQHKQNDSAAQFSAWFKTQIETDPEENYYIFNAPEADTAKKKFMEWIEQNG